MKRYLLLIIFLLNGIWAIGGHVEPSVARRVAENWYRHYAPQAKKAAVVTKTKEYRWNGRTSFYICSFDKGGFVLVSANDAVTPVLGYGFDHQVPDSITNESVKGWFDGYARQIDTAFVLNLQQDASASKWDEILENRFPNLPGNAVAPLITTSWNQGWPYNALCPGGSLTGCVPTAMAQIMKYHNWPNQGLGSFSYDWGSYGPCPGNTYSANFGQTIYNIASMPNMCTAVDSNVARLMYHCGVACGALFGGNTSVSYSSDSDPMTRAFINYFRYASSSIRYIQAVNYAASVWDSLIQSELINNRPVYYRGDGVGSHAFVCDGVDESDYYHFNFGWGGSCNGYYSLAAITPGSFNFTNNQNAIIGIKPNDGSTIVENTTWSGNVQFNTIVSIADGIMVTVNPGSTISFSKESRLLVYGGLISTGNSQNLVRFTAIDTSQGWSGIMWDNVWKNRMVMANNDSSKLIYTQVEYSHSCGIFSNAFGKLVLDHCTFKYNHGTNGAGVSVWGEPIQMHYCELAYNHASIYGGGLMVTGTYMSYFEMDHNSFHDNEASVGGGFHFMSVNNIVFRWNDIQYNFAYHGAGGSVHCASPTLINNTVCNNTTPFNGGGALLFQWQCNARVINNLIANNSTSGIYCTDNSNPIIINSVIVKNNHTFACGLVFGANSNAVIKNSIIYGNNPDNSTWGTQIAIWDGNCDPIFDHCNIEGGLAAFGGPGSGSNYTTANYTNNIDLPPQFISPSAGVGAGYNGLLANWQLQSSSPCIDGGDTTGISTLLPAMDLAGNPRINGTIDMGAYEYSTVPQQQTLINATITNGQNCCFNASKTITVAGGGTTFQVQPGGSATMIAGEKIIFLPTTTVQSGGLLHGYISPTGPWCNTPAVPSVAMGRNLPPVKSETTSFNVYPNPTTGRFFVEFSGDGPPRQGVIEIYDMQGEKIMTQSIKGEVRYEYNLTNRPPGIYCIRISDGNILEIRKVLKK